MKFTMEFTELVKKYNVDLVGGDTTSSTSGLVITITAIGLENSENLVTRNGAKPMIY